jgi:hypothetical protein
MFVVSVGYEQRARNRRIVFMHALLKQLAGTDRRSIGRSNQVVKQVLANPKLFRTLIAGMLDADPIIRMRSADAVEKITAIHPTLLRAYKKLLLHQVARSDQPEVRWHVAQLFSRLELTPKERRLVMTILAKYLHDKSSIVKTFSMQALADIAIQEPELRPGIVRKLERLTLTGTPAMRARGKKLIVKPSHHLRHQKAKKVK